MITAKNKSKTKQNVIREMETKNTQIKMNEILEKEIIAKNDMPTILIEFSNKEIKQTVSSFDSNIETIYLKNDNATNSLNTHVYQNNVFNIGVAFCKYNFSFHLDQVLHFYILDKVSTFILNNKRNFSYFTYENILSLL